MAVNKENLDLDAEAARPRPIELITENGYIIVRAVDLDVSGSKHSDAGTFLVHGPDNRIREIKVEFAEGFRNEINLRSARQLPTRSSYWICCAERHLAAYLWENDAYPPNSTLRVAELTPDDVNLAHRWDRGGWEIN